MIQNIAMDITNLSTEEAQKVVAVHGKFKARSHDTNIETHFPELDERAGEQFEVVLIGDSMLERLKTTGTSTRIAQMKSMFNAGVGGDKIENVLYRLGTLGMMLKLSDRNVKLWIVEIGTNNLKKALNPKEIELYRLLIRTLLKMSPLSRIIACEIFKRKDIDDGHVDGSNRLVQGMVKELNDSLREERIIWVDAPEVTDEMLDDHVHLNEQGYKIWDEVLYPRIQELL